MSLSDRLAQAARQREGVPTVDPRSLLRPPPLARRAVSIVLDGQAVNITLCSRDRYLDFGIIGCRRSVPHLQRLLTHLETSLAELETAWG